MPFLIYSFPIDNWLFLYITFMQQWNVCYLFTIMLRDVHIDPKGSAKLSNGEMTMVSKEGTHCNVNKRNKSIFYDWPDSVKPSLKNVPEVRKCKCLNIQVGRRVHVVMV